MPISVYICYSLKRFQERRGFLEELGQLAILTDGSLPENTQTPTDKVIPFFVIADGQEIRGDQISVADFVELQKNSKRPPSTSMVREIDFLKEFEELYERGFRRFVVLTVPENKSGTFSQAKMAAEAFRKMYLRSEFLVFDTGTTAGGVEFMVNQVDKMRNFSLKDIEGALSKFRERIELFLVLDTVAYIGASGRVEELSSFKLRDTLQRYARGVAAWFASRTHHSPKVLITFNQGREKITGFGRFYLGMVEKIESEIKDRISNGRVLNEILVFHSNSEAEVNSLMKRLAPLVEDKIQVRTDVSIALRSITGPKFIAVFCRYVN